jgi:hypothetical protein
VGLLAARLAGVVFVFRRHHSDHHLRLGKRVHVAIDGRCARGARHVIAVSDAAREIMVNVERVPASRITVVLNGMEPVRPVAPEVVARLRAQWTDGDRPICLTSARLHEEKGHRGFCLLPARALRHAVSSRR